MKKLKLLLVNGSIVEGYLEGFWGDGSVTLINVTGLVAAPTQTTQWYTLPKVVINTNHIVAHWEEGV